MRPANLTLKHSFTHYSPLLRAGEIVSLGAIDAGHQSSSTRVGPAGSTPAQHVHAVSTPQSTIGGAGTELRVGMRVVSPFIMPCGSCHLCVKGRVSVHELT